MMELDTEYAYLQLAIDLAHGVCKSLRTGGGWWTAKRVSCTDARVRDVVQTAGVIGAAALREKVGDAGVGR